MLRPRTAIRDLPSYHPPLSGRQGLRLDFNENTVGCSPRVLDRLRRLGSEDLARYPEREPVERIVAGFFGVPSEQVLLTNGVDEAIHLLCQTYLEPGDEALIMEPTYSMYRIYMMAAGAQVISAPPLENFRFPAAELLNRISNRTRLIAIANPNNPTGMIAPQDDLIRISRAAPQAAVLIDEAYFEFCGQSVLPVRGSVPNLFVARTFSKAYGMAGLRAGALVGDTNQMRLVRQVSSPYNVNAVALACLPEALADQAYIAQYVSQVRESRQRLEKTLQSAAIQFWPSQANFVLFRVGSTRAAAAAFVEQMRHKGVLVRDRSADPACEGCVRVTLGPPEHTDRLLRVLRETLETLPIAEGVLPR